MKNIIIRKSISKDDIRSLIEPFLFDQLDGECYELEVVKASKFLNGSRFDLAIKLTYLELNEKNQGYAESIYKDHIRAFSFGSYREFGNKSKDSIEKYIQVFNDILLNIDAKGFDEKKSLVPVASQGVIVNGAHRVSCGIFLNKSIKIIRIPDFAKPKYDYKFFHARNVPVKYLDHAAITFSKYASNSYIACIWPSASATEIDFEEVVGNIAYKKEIEFTELGAKNLILQIYRGEQWLGDVKNGFKGAEKKASECFANKSPAKFYLFQEDNFEKVLDIKSRIRNICNLGKHSIHITDTHDEVKFLSHLVFNENSIHFLNHANPYRYQRDNNRLTRFIESLDEMKLPKEDLVIDGGMVFSAYGFRSADDIDYLSHRELVLQLPGLEAHDNELLFHDKKKEDLIFNPENYFYFNGIKFVSLSQTLLMKRNRYKVRKDSKDQEDIVLVESLVNKRHFRAGFTRLKQSCRYYKKVVLINFIHLLKAVKVYDLLRVAYRSIKAGRTD